MKIKIWYQARDCGDGSTSVDFFTSQAELDAAIEEQEENGEYYDNNGSWEIFDTDLCEVIED